MYSGKKQTLLIHENKKHIVGTYRLWDPLFFISDRVINLMS